MNIRSYDQMSVEIIRHTENPGELVREALNRTMKKDAPNSGVVSSNTLAFLINANHGSIIEHVSFTFDIKGVSRAFLAQITRHRMASYTSSSQHYQDYRDYPMVVSEAMKNDEIAESCLTIALDNYKYLVDQHETKPEEARMILPNACEVNLLWTINARSLSNFISQRACRRNVEEMRIFASHVINELEMIWVEFARVLGPECYRLGVCLQGKMSCGKPWPRSEYGL